MDNNQILNLEEWFLFCALYTAHKKARGEKEIKKTETERLAFYNAINKIDLNVDGLSIWDIAIGSHFGREVFGQKLQENYEDHQTSMLKTVPGKGIFAPTEHLNL